MNMTKKMVLAAVVLPLTLGTASVFAYGGVKGNTKDLMMNVVVEQIAALCSN